MIIVKIISGSPVIVRNEPISDDGILPPPPDLQNQLSFLKTKVSNAEILSNNFTFCTWINLVWIDSTYRLIFRIKQDNFLFEICSKFDLDFIHSINIIQKIKRSIKLKNYLALILIFKYY